MTSKSLLQLRLINQQIAGTSFTKPAEIISWLGAMQAQEYAMAKWAIALRLPGCTNQHIEDAFNKGEILRTHVLRPTWHFVAPADIRWLLKLTAPRVHAFNAYYYRQRELDDKLFARCHKILTKALQGGKHLTRTELQDALTKAKIITDGVRLATITMHAELEGLICSGPRKGKQFTYALIDERVTATTSLDRDEALTKLVRQYFLSRGPAMLQDFCWWSGLAMKDAKDGIAMLGKQLRAEVIDEKEYWLMADQHVEKVSLNRSYATFLMPDYDEYGISYKDRSALSDEYDAASRQENPVYNRMIVVEGRIVGSWKANVGKRDVEVESVFFNELSTRKLKAVDNAVKLYREFRHG
jgi:hypothetical protein